MKHILLYRSIAIILLKYRYSYSEKKYHSSPVVMYRCIVAANICILRLKQPEIELSQRKIVCNSTQLTDQFSLSSTSGVENVE